MVWFGGAEPSKVILLMQDFIFKGGLYGTFENRVAISQEKKGGKFGYLIKRIFVPTSKLVRYYPVLEKHPYLSPVMQVRRWFMLASPEIRKMAKNEIKNNFSIEKEKAKEMKSFLEEIGL